MRKHRIAIKIFKLIEGAGKLAICMILALAVELLPTALRASTALFLAPVNDQVTPSGFSVDPDYQQLFQPGAPWQKAISRVNAFEIVNHYVFTQDEDILRNIFSFLHEHHIALAVVFGLVPSTNGCGRGIEGATAGQYNLGVAKRLKKLGADLKYIVVDAALTFGHFSTAPNACRYSIDQLAAGFASEAAKIRSIYPDTPIIDVEGESGVGTPNDLGLWLDALRRNMGDGAPIAIRFDVQWASAKKPWRQIAPALVDSVLQHGYRYGIIYDGNPLDPTAEAWIRSAKEHIEEWRSVVHSPPDHVAIESWHRFPERVLPETSPTTLTNLVNWYYEH